MKWASMFQFTPGLYDSATMVHNSFLTMARKRKNSRKIKGTDREEVLTGTKRRNVIWGYEGDDRIESGEGMDKAYGGPGDDTFVTVNDGKGYVKIMDFQAGDSIEFCGCSATTIEMRKGESWIVNGNDVMAVAKGVEAVDLKIDFEERVITFNYDLFA